MKDKHLLAFGVAAAALFYLYRRSGDGGGVLPSFPLTLSNGLPLPNVDLVGTLPSSPLRLSNGAPLPYVGLVPYRPIEIGGDATSPNVALDAQRASNTPTYAGWNGVGVPQDTTAHTWGVPDVGGYPQVGLVPPPDTSADLLQQARDDSESGDIVIGAAGMVDYESSPSVTPDTARAAIEPQYVQAAIEPEMVQAAIEPSRGGY